MLLLHALLFIHYIKSFIFKESFVYLSPVCNISFLPLSCLNSLTFTYLPFTMYQFLPLSRLKVFYLSPVSPKGEKRLAQSAYEWKYKICKNDKAC